MADNLAQAPFHGVTTKAGVSAGTTVTITTANTQLYALNGKAFTRAAAANSAVTTPTIDILTGVAIPALAINQGTVVLVLLDSAGNQFYAQGSIVALDGAVTATAKFIQAPSFPLGIPQTLVPMAYGIVKNGSNGAAFTVGTTTWNAANSSVAFVDLMTLPDRPQVA